MCRYETVFHVLKYPAISTIQLIQIPTCISCNTYVLLLLLPIFRNEFLNISNQKSSKQSFQQTYFLLIIRSTYKFLYTN